MKLITRILFLLLMLFTVSCSSEQSIPTNAPSIPTNPENVSYPAPQTNSTPYSFALNYPAPSENYPNIRIPKGSLPNLPNSAPVPEQGKASISGVLFDFGNSMVLPITAFYITPAKGASKKDPPPLFLGPHPEKGDLNSFSDKLGLISINNIPPGNYYLAVMGAMDWRIAQMSITDEKPLLIELAEGQRLTLGVIYVP